VIEWIQSLLPALAILIAQLNRAGDKRDDPDLRRKLLALEFALGEWAEAATQTNLAVRAALGEEVRDARQFRRQLRRPVGAQGRNAQVAMEVMFDSVYEGERTTLYSLLRTYAPQLEPLDPVMNNRVHQLEDLLDMASIKQLTLSDKHSLEIYVAELERAASELEWAREELATFIREAFRLSE